MFDAGAPRARSIIFQQPLDVIELKLRAEALAEALAQLLENAAGPLHVDLSRHLDGGVVAVVAPTQRTAEWVGILVGACLTGAPRVARTHALSHLLLHRLRHALRALAHRLERAALRIHRAVGITLAERALGVAHRLAGATERIAFATLVALLALAR